MSVTAAIVGGAAALLGNVISGIVGSKNQNDNIDKQIAAQKEENAKTREHNLQLAQLQNTMNVKQWQRENQYNSPAAQMQRFQAAGLNPNLIYGQSNTSGQISGSLTSGAPATPVDMSALGNKRSGLASAFKAAGDAAMQFPTFYEQVRGMRLENDLKEQRLKREKEDDDFTSFLRYFDPDIPGDQMLSPKWSEYKNSVAGRRVLEEFDELWYRNYKESLNLGAYEYEAETRKIDALLARDLKKQVAAVARNMDVPKSDFETVAKAMIYSARGIKADALLKEAEAILSDPSFIEKLPQGLPALARFLRMLLK